ncbi:MAG TPA: SDR family oxidoreductase [Anaerolineae bacterium]|nr:SDR family oxidoreductase [Anaerolineae bacterium]HQI84781.1 SDR family oxidoreductase [Anaerolineae bacterium]
MNLVTGATGHIGNVLVRELLSQGQPVRAMVLPNDDCRSLEGLNIEKVEGNVLKPETLDRAMEGVDTVYHLAGIISIVPGAETLMHKVNVDGARNTAQAALRAGVKRMVHISSIHALKRMPHGVCIDETVPFAPDNPAGAYDRTKAEGTLAVLQTVGQGLDAVIACPTGVIGPYDYLGSEMGNVILNFARKRLQFLVEGAYDFVDVRDVATGLTQAADRGRTGEAYILSGGRIEIPQIKQIVQDFVGIHTPHIIVPMWLAELFATLTESFYRITHAIPKFTRYSLRTVQENCDFSNAKARTELGYSPRPLRESITDALAWRRAAGWA